MKDWDSTPASPVLLFCFWLLLRCQIFGSFPNSIRVYSREFAAKSFAFDSGYSPIRGWILGPCFSDVGATVIPGILQFWQSTHPFPLYPI